MKKEIIIAVLSVTMSIPHAYAFFGGGGINGATETTQIANNILMGKQLAEQANMYSKQILQYKTQLEQLNLEKIASQLLDTGKFGDSLEVLEEYKKAFDVAASAKDIKDMQSMGDFVEKLGGSKDEANAAYLKQLDAATGAKYQLTKQSSDLNTARVKSVEADKKLTKELQEANAKVEGAMQAAQVGNHINSEVLAQLVKMREESAATAQIRTMEKKIALEEEELIKAKWEATYKRMQENRKTMKAEYGSYGD